MADYYKTLQNIGTATYREKMSRFIAFAVPVTDAETARDVIKRYRNEYHDARHVCWAYMLGVAREDYLSNDNGEPSGTAGKPILGQINSFGLTNVVIVVVRYFGGIKLGTSGLTNAYREAARMAIEAATVIECHEQARLTFTFAYLQMNDVMTVVKRAGLRIVGQTFDNTCEMTVECDVDNAESVGVQLVAAGASIH
mgnify:CR=1 FL=1